MSERSKLIRSTTATTPWPPAAQIEISPRPPPRSPSSLASVARIRPPVAANGWPAASEEPATLSFARSIVPSAVVVSQAASVASTCEANASWIS